MTFEITIRQSPEDTMDLHGWIHRVNETTGAAEESFVFDPVPMTGLSVKDRMNTREKFIRTALSQLFLKMKTTPVMEEKKEG